MERIVDERHFRAVTPVIELQASGHVTDALRIVGFSP